jgi:8-oxo-dGTP pyrophosphatase MutT (NUDIX family)
MPHIHEKIDFSADTFVVFKNKVLLRKHDKYKIWLPPGGHVELDEDPNEAAIREVKEEVGLTVKLWDTRGDEKKIIDGTASIIPPIFLNRHRINEHHEHISFVYFATTIDPTITQNIQREMSDEIHWFTKEDLDSSQYDIRENIKHYAHTALDAVAKGTIKKS